MKTADLSELPPLEVPEEFEGRNQRWSVWCKYRDFIDSEVQIAVLDAIDTSAGFVYMHEEDEQLLQGQWDLWMRQLLELLSV